MSVWWTPQSVTWPPEYSSHQRKSKLQRCLQYGTFGAWPSQKSQSSSAGGSPFSNGPPFSPVAHRAERTQVVSQPTAAREHDRLQEHVTIFAALLRAHLQTSPVSLATWQIFLPSSTVSVSGFSQ